MRAMPLFLENDSWYTEDVDEDGHVKYHLTDAAPEEARKSYEDYYSEPAFYCEDGKPFEIPEGWVLEA